MILRLPPFAREPNNWASREMLGTCKRFGQGLLWRYPQARFSFSSFRSRAHSENHYVPSANSDLDRIEKENVAPGPALVLAHRRP